MDFEELTASSEWLKKCESPTDLSIIMRVSMEYAESNEKNHTKHQLIELYKVCHEMACLLKDKMMEIGICNRIGLLYFELSRFNDALNYHMKALCLCQETGHIAEEGRSYGIIGNMYRSLCQYEKAIEYQKKHLHICQETGDLAGEGKSCGNIGIVYHSLGQYEKAMEYHKKRLRICQETGDVAGEGKSCGNIGTVYHSLGQYEKAMEYLKKHLRICQETGDLAGEGGSYGNIGIVYWSLGQYKKALEYHKKYLRTCQETGNLAGEGASCGNIGIVYAALGQYEKAMEYHKKHLRICQETGDLAGEGKSCGNIGNVYDALGQYEKSMEYHKKHLRICQETGDLAGEGRTCGNIGNVYDALGQYEKAIEYHKKDFHICQETGDLAGEGASCGNIGSAYKSLCQYEKAMEYLKKDLHICQETGDLAGEGNTCGNIGSVYKSLCQYEKAMEYLKKYLRICQETGDLVGEGKAHFNIGDINGAEASLKESLHCFEEVFKLLHQQDDYKVSIVDTYIEAYHSLTKVLIASGKEEEALLVSERGRSQALKDKLMMKYGLPQGEEGGELLNEDIASLVSSSDSSFLCLSFPKDKVSLFVIEQGKELYLRETLPDSFAFCANSDCSSSALGDILLESYINKMLQDVSEHVNTKRNNSCEDRSMNRDQDKHPDHHSALDDPLSADDEESVTTNKEKFLEDNASSCVSSYSRAPTGHSDKNIAISESQSKEGQASQPIIGKITPESKHEVHSETALPSSEPFSKEEDVAVSQNFTAAKQPNDDQNGANVFENLFQVLIAPVQEALTKPEIVIIPEGPLFLVPFAALKDKSGTYLSETKRIRLGPSLTTLKILKECPAEKHCQTGALIVGSPIAGEVMYEGKKKIFSDLPFARQEARMIGRVLGEKPLIGSSATKDEVKRRLQEGVSIIHIATHGNETTGELLLAPGPCVGKEIPEEEDYLLTVKEIYSSGINAQLVVLSCCHSGRGEIKAEGVVGLTRAFLAAGARSVLASLWAVDDAATRYFMERFYRHLKSGESACSSLQQAMGEMRKTPAWSHPYYWAPFFIVGDDIRITI